jgi:hypothetical protein
MSSVVICHGAEFEPTKSRDQFVVKCSGLGSSALDTMFVRINVIKSHIVVLLKSGLDVQQPGLPIKRTSLGAF